MNHLVVIVGPTAIGKSELALRLAQNLDGEIISADSRQVYRFMNIGTAKPTPDDLSLVPHHLIDIVNPDEDFSLARYQKLAIKAITEAQNRKRLPLLVGGSGQYIWSILEGWKIPPVLPDPEFRRSLEERQARDGQDGLYQELIKVDPVAAEKIGPFNTRRVIRALEVYHETKIPISQLQRKEPPPFVSLVIGLTTNRSELYHRIDRRVDSMIERGLVTEVAGLLKKGYSPELPAMSSLGYRQIGRFLRDELSLNTAIQQIKFDTHRFTRRQYTWFSLKDNRITWFDPRSGKIDSQVSCLIRESMPGLASGDRATI
jgi:tRNA dimethylallyltransferase